MKFRSLVVSFLVKLLGPLIKLLKVIIYYSLPKRISQPSTIDVLESRSLESSAKYVENYGQYSMIFKQRTDLWSFAVKNTTLQGIFAEFGVSFGKSLKFISSQLPKDKIIYGFDSFQGLKEDFWGTSFVKGTFTTNGMIPKFADNVVLVKGWFHESLPSFLNQNAGVFSFLHFDADTYTSTKEILGNLKGRIVPGTIVVFDEYIGYPNWENNEARAWKEFVESSKLNYKYIAFSNQSAVIRITE